MLKRAFSVTLLCMLTSVHAAVVSMACSGTSLDSQRFEERAQEQCMALGNMWSDLCSKVAILYDDSRCFGFSALELIDELPLATMRSYPEEIIIIKLDFLEQYLQKKHFVTNMPI